MPSPVSLLPTTVPKSLMSEAELLVPPKVPRSTIRRPDAEVARAASPAVAGSTAAMLTSSSSTTTRATSLTYRMRILKNPLRNGTYQLLHRRYIASLRV
jgi:hypothetical protein